MDSEIEMLSDSFLEELKKLKDILEDSGLSGYSEGDEEETEEKEYAMSLSAEDMKKYQEKFEKRVREIKEGLEKIYETGKGKEKDTVYSKNEKMKDLSGMKSPWERGHKLGCGCPGCTKYREFHGIPDRNAHQEQNPGMEIPDPRFSGNSKKSKHYVEKESDTRPCGGKYWQIFHRKKGMDSVFGSYGREALKSGMVGY